MGIEPTPSAWKAEILPLNYTRLDTRRCLAFRPLPRAVAFRPRAMVEGVGFEPTKASPADLQSAPVDRLGTPPSGKAGHYEALKSPCQGFFYRNLPDAGQLEISGTAPRFRARETITNGVCHGLFYNILGKK